MSFLIGTFPLAGTVDRFASAHNAKVGRFNSKFWNPGTEAVDGRGKQLSIQFDL